MVRPAGLTNNSVTDKEFTVKEDYHVGFIKVKFQSNSYVQVSGSGGRIARADVARFMLSTLSSEEYLKKGVAIAV